MYIPLGKNDDTFVAVLNAKKTVELPEVAVITHFGKAFEDFINENNCNKVDTLYLETTKTNIYVVEKEGKKVVLVKPLIGAPMTTNTIEHLIANGVKAIVACDDLYSNNDEDIGKVIIPTSVIRGDGVSKQYVKTSRSIITSADEVNILTQRLKENNIDYYEEEILATDVRRNKFDGIYSFEAAATLSTAIFRNIEAIYFGCVRGKEGKTQKIEDELLDVALMVANDLLLKKEFYNKNSLSNNTEEYKVEVENKPIETKEEKMPETVAMCFFEEIIDEYKDKIQCKQIPISIRGETFYAYVANVNGKEVGFTQALIGTSASAMLMEELISMGTKNVLACGGAGILENEQKAIYVPTVGLKNDGVSTNLFYGDFVHADKEIVNIIKKYYEDKPFRCVSCATWTTDASRRETRDVINSRISDIKERIYPEIMPILVEMEFTALISTAKNNNINFGQILYGGDKLFKDKDYDANNWTSNSIREFLFESILDLASSFDLELEMSKEAYR